MTTPEAARAYLAQHLREWEGKGYTAYNPNGLPLDELPVIYGFNNGGQRGFMHAALIAQDGTCLGGHMCSHEGYMLADLGIVEGSRPDRHEECFKKHYPNGYRMDFVGRDELDAHKGLNAAIEANKLIAEAASVKEAE